MDDLHRHRVWRRRVCRRDPVQVLDPVATGAMVGHLEFIVDQFAKSKSISSAPGMVQVMWSMMSGETENALLYPAELRLCR